MPIFDLGRLGRFQISYLPPSDMSQGNHQDIPSGPPPEYTDIAESEIKYTSPPQAQPPECKTEQVRRFLIEIVAITFNADFDSLNAALYNMPVSDNTNTILCDSERADLVAQSDLVRKVHRHFLDNTKTHISQQDERAICSTITLAVAHLRVAPPLTSYQSTLPHFTLDMIGWYGEETRHPSGTRWTSTLPGHWDTNSLGYCDQEQVMLCMRSLFHIIKDIAPNDKVHDVLMEAWDTCRRRGGWPMDTLLGDSKMCWPMRKGYHHMGDALRDMPLLGPWVVVGESNEAHWVSSATSKYSISPFVRTMGVVSANGM
ncbi:uncharacterized protein J4E79_011393 [Alternaria viburni]|uniref:uncharacterized protein n=1 Tax=Alternaria viburni TaxID=566460 RepID=UPI0020C24CFD|nr:uncharacterized protein J4E79_011393 [Alternaria viburni]KAI4642777.1 hypothetical protein J4E79_011393 [Alternaria viburni]